MNEESSLAGLYERICQRNGELEIQTKKFAEKVSTNYAEFRAYSKKANSTIGCLKVFNRHDNYNRLNTFSKSA